MAGKNLFSYEKLVRALLSQGATPDEISRQYKIPLPDVQKIAGAVEAEKGPTGPEPERTESRPVAEEESRPVTVDRRRDGKFEWNPRPKLRSDVEREEAAVREAGESFERDENARIRGDGPGPLPSAPAPETRDSQSSPEKGRGRLSRVGVGLGKGTARAAAFSLEERGGIIGKKLGRRIRKKAGIGGGEHADETGVPVEVVVAIDGVARGVVDAVRKAEQAVARALGQIVEATVKSTERVVGAVDSIADKLGARDRERRESAIEGDSGSSSSGKGTDPVSGVDPMAAVLGALLGGLGKNSDDPVKKTDSDPNEKTVNPSSPDDDGKREIEFRADEIIFDADSIRFTQPLVRTATESVDGAFSGSEGGQDVGPYGAAGSPGPIADGGPVERPGGGKAESSVPTPDGGTARVPSSLLDPMPMFSGSHPDQGQPRRFTGSVGKYTGVASRPIAPGEGGSSETPVPGRQGSYSGAPSSASEAMLRSIMTAETGSGAAALDEKRFVRTRVTPDRNKGRHSSAYGPVQMTRDYLKEFAKRHRDSLPPEEREYLDRLLSQGDKMLKTGRAGDWHDPTYGYGGRGTEGQTLRDRQLYGQIAQRSLVDLANQNDSYAGMISSFRGRGEHDPAYFKKVADAARAMGKTPEELFAELKSSRVTDVPSLPDPGLGDDTVGRLLSPSDETGLGTPGKKESDQDMIQGRIDGAFGDGRQDMIQNRIDGAFGTDQDTIQNRIDGAFADTPTGDGSDINRMSTDQAASPLTVSPPDAPPPTEGGQVHEKSKNRIEPSRDSSPPSTNLPDHFQDFPGLGREGSPGLGY